MDGSSEEQLSEELSEEPDRPLVSLDDLTDEILFDEVCAQLTMSLNGPCDLCRLARCCRRLHAGIMRDATFVSRRGSERGVPGVTSLEELAVLEAVQNIGPDEVRCTFHGADTTIRPGSLARIDDVAHLMLLHPTLTLCIDAHTGRNAPDLFASVFTWQRARSINRRLITGGISYERIRSRGWGKRIAVAAGWQPGVESARAELYLSLGGVEMPPRPELYERAEAEQLPMERRPGHPIPGYMSEEPLSDSEEDTTYDDVDT
jgi:hypothetical protein